MKKIFTVAAAFVLVAGCANRRPPAPPLPPFPEAEYAALEKSGNAGVKGQLFMKTRGGEVRKGAGVRILLRPKTNYAMAAASGVRPGRDYRLSTYDRSTVSDGDGKFEFKEIPAGEYILSGHMTWSVFMPGTFGPIEQVQGGTVAEYVTVESGKVQEVMLTK